MARNSHQVHVTGIVYDWNDQAAHPGGISRKGDSHADVVRMLENQPFVGPLRVSGRHCFQPLNDRSDDIGSKRQTYALLRQVCLMSLVVGGDCTHIHTVNCSDVRRGESALHHVSGDDLAHAAVGDQRFTTFLPL